LEPWAARQLPVDAGARPRRAQPAASRTAKPACLCLPPLPARCRYSEGGGVALAVGKGTSAGGTLGLSLTGSSDIKPNSAELGLSTNLQLPSTQVCHTTCPS
jgi:hypothetical protein